MQQEQLQHLQTAVADMAVQLARLHHVFQDLQQQHVQESVPQQLQRDTRPVVREVTKAMAPSPRAAKQKKKAKAAATGLRVAMKASV